MRFRIFGILVSTVTIPVNEKGRLVRPSLPLKATHQRDILTAGPFYLPLSRPVPLMQNVRARWESQIAKGAA